MQALPTASPIAPVAPSVPQPANAPAAEAAPMSGTATDSAPESAVPFEKVLASQIDADNLRPDLVAGAANADLAEELETEQDPLAALGKDGALDAQLLNLNPMVPPAPSTDTPAGGDASREDLAVQVDSLATGRLAGTDRPGDEGLKLATDIADLRELTAGKGADREPAQANGAATEQSVQPQAMQGGQESQRLHPGARHLEGAAFNPRVIPEPVKSPQWGEALGQRVVWMAKENVQVVYLQVDPPNLGPLEVQLRLSNDQANLMFVSSHASVRDAISSSLPKLDELLSAGGVSLGSVSVDTQSPSRDPGQRPDGSPSRAESASWEIDIQTGEALRPVRPLVIGLVDTFA